MSNDLVTVTYKRRRFYDRSKAFHGVEAINSSLDSSKADINGSNVNLNEDNKSCVACGAFGTTENLLDHDGCCEKLQCSEPSFKNIPQVRWQCAGCIKKQAFEQSAKNQTLKSHEARKPRNTEESNICAVELFSNLLPSIEAYERGSSSAVDASSNKITGHIQIDNSSKLVKKLAPSNDSLEPQRTDSDFARKTKHNCLESPAGIKCNSARPDDSVPLILDLNENLNDTYSEAYLREKCNAPLLTFSRRAKRKQGISEVSKSILETKDKHSLFSNSRQILLDETCKSEVCSPRVTLTGQENIVGALSREAELHTLDAVQKDTVFNKNELKDATSGCSFRTKIDGKIFEESPVNMEASNMIPFNHIKNVPQGPSVSILSESTPDMIVRNLVHKDLQMKSTYTNTFVMEKPKNNDLTVNSEKALLGNNTSFRKGLPLNQKLSVVSGSCTYVINKEALTTSLPEALPISAHASIRLNSTNENKEVMGMPARKIMESRILLNHDSTFSLGVKSDIKGKRLDFSEEKLAQKPAKDQNMSFFKQDGANCRQVSSENASHLFAAHASLGQHIPADSVNHLNPQQGTRFTSRLASSVAPTVRDIGRTPSGSFNGKTNINDMKFMWHGLSGNSSKQLVDDIMMGSWMCKQREASRTEWLENELDCLWVGVRRHGIGNWDSLLRDSRLLFSESRVAEDLAEQWNLEQRKFFNGMLMQPARLNRPYRSPFSPSDVLSKSLHRNQHGRYSSSSDIQRSSTETELSLGDVYLQKENVSKRSLSNAMGNSFMEGNQSAGFLSCSYPKISLWAALGSQIPPAPKNGRPTPPDQSCSVQKNIEESCHENPCDKLPHWLKDVFAVPPSASGRHTPPDASANKNTLLTKDHGDGAHSPGESSFFTKSSNRRGLLKRSTTSKLSRSCCKPYIEAGPVFASDQSFECARPAGSGLKQNIVFDLNKKIPESSGPTESVLMESDVSSEGTISDDQSSRP